MRETKMPKTSKKSTKKAKDMTPKLTKDDDISDDIGAGTRGAGRPLIQITAKVLEDAMGLASQGLSQKDIAYCLGMGESTFYEKVKEYPEFLESIAVGKAKGTAAMSNAVFNKGLAGDMTAATFWLRTRAKHLYGDSTSIDLNLRQTSNLTEAEKELADRILDDIVSGKAH